MRAAGCFRARAYMSEENEMALPRLVILELLLYASCFICGIVTAASLIIVQVKPNFKVLVCTLFLSSSIHAVILIKYASYKQ